MTVHWKLVIDAADPHRQAEFWATALEYLVEDHSALIGQLAAAGHLPPGTTSDRAGRQVWADLAAVRHPDDPFEAGSGTGLGRRILFQRVPETKQGKNRLHLDLHVGADRRPAVVELLTGLGATTLREVSEYGSSWIVMSDPEGNEFDVV
jgi:hypothetical protein